MSIAVHSRDFVARAGGLKETLRSRRMETDELRRVPDASVAEVCELDLPWIATPTALGGSELGVDSVYEVARELGKGCGATAWCVGVWAVHGTLTAMFPVEGQQEVFADGHRPLISTGFSPARGKTRMTEGGAILSGQWDFSSGVDHAEWVIVVAVGEQGPFAHIVRASEVEIVDTWQVSGLRGSGSKDIACQAFVPEHRILSMIGPARGTSIARELYDSPWFNLPLSAGFGSCVIGAVIGMCQGALEVFVETTKEKIGGTSGIKLADRSDVHLRVGEAGAKIDGADEFVRATYGEMRDFVFEGREITPEDHVRWMRNIAYSGHTALEGLNLLFEIGGAHVLWLDDQLQQFQRDATAGTHHYALSRHTWMLGYGREAIGLGHGIAAM